jgi:hypothetical protein
VSKTACSSATFWKGKASGCPLVCVGRLGWKMQLRVLWSLGVAFQLSSNRVRQSSNDEGGLFDSVSEVIVVA